MFVVPPNGFDDEPKVTPFFSAGPLSSSLDRFFLFSSPLTNGGTGTGAAEGVEAPKEKPLNPASADGLSLSAAAGVEVAPNVNPPLGCARGGFVAVAVLAVLKTSDAGTAVDVVVDAGVDTEDAPKEKLDGVDAVEAGTGAVEVAPKVKEEVDVAGAVDVADDTGAEAPKLNEGVDMVADLASAVEDLGAESLPNDGVDTDAAFVSLSLGVSVLPKPIIGDVFAFDASPSVSVETADVGAVKLKEGAEDVVAGTVAEDAELVFPNEKETAGLGASDPSDFAGLVDAPKENPAVTAGVDVVVAGVVEAATVEVVAPKVKPPAEGAGVELEATPKEKPDVDAVDAGAAEALTPNVNPLLDADDDVVAVVAGAAEEEAPAAQEGNFGGPVAGAAVEGAVPRGLSQATHLAADLSF